jgi:hypothetical protein
VPCEIHLALFTWTVPKWINSPGIDATAWEAAESCFWLIDGFNEPNIHNNLSFNVTKHIVYAVYFKSCRSRVNKRSLNRNLTSVEDLKIFFNFPVKSFNNLSVLYILKETKRKQKEKKKGKKKLLNKKRLI